MSTRTPTPTASPTADLIDASTPAVRHPFLGTFDGYEYARGRHYILRRRVSSLGAGGEPAFWTVFCGADAWPIGADARTIITEQLSLPEPENDE